MRIAQAIALYAPEFQGGATLVCRRLARELAARGHVLDVVSGRTTAAEPIGALRTDLVDGIRTWRVNLGGAFHGHSREGWENPAATSSVRRFLAERRPDVLHVHGLQALGAGVIRAAAAAGVPVVWTMHDWWWLCPCLFRLAPGSGPCSPIPDPSRCFPGAEFPFEERRATLAAALEAVARVLVPTAYLRDSLVANGLDPARVSVQENGIEPPSPDFAVLRSRRARDGVLRLGFVGGAGNREKGLGVLLDAASRVRADVEIRLHAVDPADAGPARGGARLEFLPPFAPEGLDAALADLDAVVVPSLMRESCSLVTREALVRGLPVVTSDCGGPEEVVRHGVNGLVFDTGSAAGLAAAIERLAGEPGLLERLAASPRPELVTPGEQAGSAEALYREVVREAASGRRGIVGGSPRPRTASAASGEPQRAGRAPVATRPREGQAPPGLRSVLFLVGVDGAPLRYRVWHLVERLALRGVHSEVLHHSDSDARAAAARTDCVVLARAPFGKTVAAVVEQARARGVPVVFSADDLVFSPGDCDAPALSNPREDVVRGFRWTLDAYARSLAASDAFLGSTEVLVEAAREHGVPGLLVRNGIGRAMLARLDRARRARIAAEDALLAPPCGVRIGFLTGTDTHDRDLESIAAPLARALGRVPDATLVVVGPARLPAALEAMGERVERVPFVPWSAFAGILAGLDLCLAPLERPNRFNEAKSEVKLIEAALAGVATVASPTGPFRHASGDGRFARLAGGPDDWETAVVELATDPDLRRGLARAARRHVVFRYGPHVQADALVDGLVDIVARGARAGRPPLPEPVELDGDGERGSCVAIEPSDLPWDAWQLAADEGAIVGPGREVEQEIPVRAAGLRRIDVLVGTFWRRNRHALDLSLRDALGREIGRRRVDAERLVDRGWLSIEVDDAVGPSPGGVVTLRVEAPGASPGDEVLLWHGASAIGALRVGGEVVPGRALAFRSFGEGA